MEGYDKKTKQYHSFAMQFGWGMSTITYVEKKKYTYIDKRTKKYGAQRPHKGEIGKYKQKIK